MTTLLVYVIVFDDHKRLHLNDTSQVRTYTNTHSYVYVRYDIQSYICRHAKFTHMHAEIHEYVHENNVTK